jgi:hypothetical protein
MILFANMTSEVILPDFSKKSEFSAQRAGSRFLAKLRAGGMMSPGVPK